MLPHLAENVVGRVLHALVRVVALCCVWVVERGWEQREVGECGTEFLVVFVDHVSEHAIDLGLCGFFVHELEHRLEDGWDVGHGVGREVGVFLCDEFGLELLEMGGDSVIQTLFVFV